MNEKPVYSQKVPSSNNVALRTLLFMGLVLVMALALFIANCLPYSGIITLVIIFLFASLTLKLLNSFVFDITYVLYSDKLVFERKYGRLSWEHEVFPLNEAEFFEDKIIHLGKTYPFSPDEKLKELIFK